jgi:hypothetical protein
MFQQPQAPAPAVQVANLAPIIQQVARSKGMRGSPPNTFDGDQSKAEKFLQAFRGYWMLNHINDSCSIPYN